MFENSFSHLKAITNRHYILPELGDGVKKSIVVVMVMEVVILVPQVPLY